VIELIGIIDKRVKDEEMSDS